MSDNDQTGDQGDDAADSGDRLPVNVSQEMQTFVEYARSLPSDDPQEVEERILRSLLTATTAEDILRAGEAMPATEVLDIPLTVMAIRGTESSYEDGSEVYLHVDAKIISNGDQVTFHCGARDVIVKLIRLDQLHMLPIDAVIHKADKPTKAGFYPLFLRALPPDERPFT